MPPVQATAPTRVTTAPAIASRSKAWGLTSILMLLYLIDYGDKALLGIAAQPLAWATPVSRRERCPEFRAWSPWWPCLEPPWARSNWPGRWGCSRDAVLNDGQALGAPAQRGRQDSMDDRLPTVKRRAWTASGRRCADMLRTWEGVTPRSGRTAETARRTIRRAVAKGRGQRPGQRSEISGADAGPAPSGRDGFPNGTRGNCLLAGTEVALCRLCHPSSDGVFAFRSRCGHRGRCVRALRRRARRAGTESPPRCRAGKRH